jgi:hypothetical protein
LGEHSTLDLNHIFHSCGERQRKRSNDHPEKQDDVAKTDDEARWKWNHADLSGRSARVSRTQL